MIATKVLKKLIKKIHGKPEEKESYQRFCGYCGTILPFPPPDICPECKRNLRWKPYT